MAKPKAPKAAKPPKKKMSKQKKKKLYWLGGVAFVGLLIMLMMMPRQGTIQYGICRVFVELSEPYPQEVRILNVDDFVPLGGPVKITYKKTDPFGIEAVNTIECFFKRDEAGTPTTTVQKIDINGKSRVYSAEHPDYIAKFNQGIPAILKNRPSLDLPDFSLDNLVDYKNTE